MDIGQPLTQGHRGDVHAPGRMLKRKNFDENQQLLLQEKQQHNEEKKNMLMLEDKEKEELENQRKRRREGEAEEAEIAKMDALVEERVDARSKMHEQISIEEVIETDARYANVDKIKWLLIDETKSKYYKVGKFKSKHDFRPLGRERLGFYLPKEDYDTFYSSSNILVFYEFENAVFSVQDLNGKFFERDESDEPSNNQQLTIDTSKNLDIKKEYVRAAKEYMKSAITQYISRKTLLNRKTNEYIPSSLRGYNEPFWSVQIQEYLNFYMKIVPMVQRNLEENRQRGNVNDAVNLLDKLEAEVKAKVESFTLEKYMTGKYIGVIEQLLSPAVAAAAAAPVAAGPSSAAAGPSSAASASAAGPSSAASSWSSYLPTSIFTSAANRAASVVGNVASNAVNWARANTGFPQDLNKGKVFAKKEAPPYIPRVAQLSGDDDNMAVSKTFNNLKVRRSEQAGFYGNTNYHGPYDNRFQLDDELMDTSKKIVGEQKAAAAAAKKPWFGGKRKSKRKQRRSRKQKKSKKQRR
jgi:hypothetical protein